MDGTLFDKDTCYNTLSHASACAQMSVRENTRCEGALFTVQLNSDLSCSACALRLWIYNKLFSSGFVMDGAGRHQTSGGEKNEALSLSLILRILLATSHAILRAHRSCFKVSSSDLSSNFALVRTSVLNHTLHGPVLSRIFTWRNVPFEF